MANPKKHSNSGAARLLQYLRGLLTKREKHAYEKSMMLDPFEEEAFEGLSVLDANEREADLLDLRDRLEKRTSKKRVIILRLPHYFAAAVLVLAIGITVWLVQRPVQETQPARQIAHKTESPPEGLKKRDRLSDTLEKTDETAAVARDVQRDITTASALARTIPATEIPPVEADKSGGLQKGKSSKKDNTGDQSFMDEIASEEGYASEQKSARAATRTEAHISLEDNMGTSAAGMHTAESINVMTYDDTRVDDQRIIRGVVFSENDGEPLPGVNVVIKGTTHGTITGIDGNFEIRVPAEGETILAFNFIGFETEELAIADESHVTLAMTEDLATLDEVVVIGYGVQRKSELTGASSTIRMDDRGSPAPVETIKPRPVSGNRDFRDYVAENIQYDRLPDFDKPVVVKLEFTVTLFGDIQNIRVARSGGDAFDKEAIRLLKNGPAWSPGTVNGEPATDQATVKVKFEPGD